MNRLLLAIGNSRLHWAWLQSGKIQESWHTPHLSTPITGDRLPSGLLSEQLNQQKLDQLTLAIASVVPSQSQLWSNYADSRTIALSEIGLKNLYPTLGIDRALALWGAGETYGYPCLVIDGGTALTLTGVDSHQRLVGGAILPGLRSQFLNLNQATAALPEIQLPSSLPSRWAVNTEQAIASGIIYTAIAGIGSYIQDWQRQFPKSPIIFTGGDGTILAQYLQAQCFTPEIQIDSQLIFSGMMLCHP